jgi:glycosyltransferase involved in cell wall biosynthesis
VITADVPALTEVAGGAAVHVASLDVEALGDALVALAGDRERRADLSALGLERARAFSWRKAALETLAVYRQVVSGHRTADRFADAPAERAPSGPPAAAARTSQRP